jgi:DNA polymerase elongation subunit (family B)
MDQPKVLVLDIETSPMLVFSWDLGNQYLGLEQLHTDRYIIAYGAKWLNDPKLLYQDQRFKMDYKDDRALVESVWKLLDEADIVLSYNGKSFDTRRLNARFMAYQMQPPSPYKHIDMYKAVKEQADFPSHTLAYTSTVLNKDYQKLQHKEFPGLLLWKACMGGNILAWDSMREYNLHDVLSTEEEFIRHKAWLPVTTPPVFVGSNECGRCGGKDLRSKGYAYTAHYKTLRLICKRCGANSQGKREKR